ncbi:DnaJ domain-containing protein [Empedobacter stercoris]|uniref:J domain-containing protein n=1 Tax=Empedobacter stercoris TaxID=1628248 RepID=UPI00166289DC|nr:DnaJ domain-containing protein [Empedobacter stercoris]MCA4809601.1 DnaJ domain-containing protein [Empedobacter stercoris]QNT13525.1 DnaJ domain-containing protein [Empedobacter stercoris]
MTNYYKILGVPDFATQDEIKKAFRKLSKKFHPDLNDGDEFFANKFRELKEAYDFLSDDNKRASLDSFLRGGSSDQSTQNNTYQEDIKREKAQEEFRRKQKAEEEELKRKKEEQKQKTEIKEKEFKINKEYEKINIHKNRNNTSLINKKLKIFLFLVVLFSLYLIINHLNNKKKEQIEIENKIRIEDSIEYVNSPPIYKLELHVDSLYDKRDKENVKPYYSLGSSMQDVINIEGKPQNIRINEDYNIDILYFGSSPVYFIDDSVTGYINSNNLKIKVTPKSNYSNKLHFKIGSTIDEVIFIEGQPEGMFYSVENGKLVRVLSYGFEYLIFYNNKLYKYSPIFNSTLKFLKEGETEIKKYSKDQFKLGWTDKDLYKKFGKPDSDYLQDEYRVLTYKNMKISFSNGKAYFIEYKEERVSSQGQLVQMYKGWSVRDVISELGKPDKDYIADRKRLIRYNNILLVLSNDKVVKIND